MFALIGRPLVREVLRGADGRVVRADDRGLPLGDEDAVQLVHELRAELLRDVLEEVRHVDFLDGGVLEGPRELEEVHDVLHARGGDEVHSLEAFLAVLAASEVKLQELLRLRGGFQLRVTFLHHSSYQTMSSGPNFPSRS